MPHTVTPLLFGNDSCTSYVDPGVLGAAMSAQWRHLQGCDVRPGPRAFRGKTASLQLPGMSLLSIAVTSLRIEVTNNAHTCLAFPLHGHARLRIQGRAFQWGVGSGSLFVPAGSGPQEAESTDQNVLMLQIDRAALDNAARAVLGLARDEAVDLGCDRPRVLGACAGLRLEAFARHIGSTIDLHDGDPQLLHRLGVQDFIYRQLVLLFRPDWRSAIPQPPQAAAPQRRRMVDRVCDAMLADLSARFTISELAALGGMSVRGLQYAFQHRFGQSPMQWLRDQRLDHVRRRLQAGAQDSIGQMALDCGFATASGFSAHYRRRYGELPTATRTKRP